MDAEKALSELGFGKDSENGSKTKKREKGLKKDFDDSDDWKSMYHDYERKQEQLRAKFMEETQEAFMEEMVNRLADIVDSETGKIRKQIMEEIENSEQKIKQRVSKNASRLGELENTVENNTDSIESMQEDRRDELEDLHERISTIRKDTEQAVDEISFTVEEAEERIDSKLGDVDSSRFDELEDRLDKINEKFQSREDRIEDIEENVAGTFEDVDVDEIDEKVHDAEKRMEKLKHKVDEFSTIEIDDDLKDEIAERVKHKIDADKVGRKEEKEKKKRSKSSKPVKPDTSGDTLSPSEIKGSMNGQNVKVKGRLQFKRSIGERKFYKLSDRDGEVIVCSKKKLPEGRRTLEGELQEIKENLCLVV